MNRFHKVCIDQRGNFFRRPTPVAIYNINWPEMRHGWLQYLNLNRTDNSTLEYNYRQQECAFWSEYMPSVVGVNLPTYRPFTEVGFISCLQFLRIITTLLILFDIFYSIGGSRTLLFQSHFGRSLVFVSYS